MTEFMAITQHFTRDEFACPCGCGFNTVDAELLILLNIIRTNFGPVTVTSGARCEVYNKKVFGASRSYHLRGKAADIKVIEGPEPLYEWLCQQFTTKYGFGKYKSWVHVDVREGKARW